LTFILPNRPAALVRTSHEYIWDMLLWHGRQAQGDDTQKARELFKRELFGVDEPLGRVVDYFKAAAAGSDVGRRLLLLLGPPSGGKSTLAILLKRGLEEYSRTDEGALYAIKGSPLRESPLNLIPTSFGRDFARRTASTYRVSSARGLAIIWIASAKAIICAYPSSAYSCRKPPVAASAPTHPTIPRPPISPIWSDPWIYPRSHAWEMRAIRAPGPGPARCTQRVAACSK